MAGRLLIHFFLLAIPLAAQSQPLSLSAEESAGRNRPSAFVLDGYPVELENHEIIFLGSGRKISGVLQYGVSSDHSLIAAVTESGGEGKVQVFDSGGEHLLTMPLSNIDPDDPSLAVIPFGNGDMLVRNNIANFVFYDAFGEVTTSFSGSSRSREGETAPQMVADPRGKTVVIYSSRIRNNGSIGSQVRVLDKRGELSNIFFSTDREVNHVSVSDDGQLILLVSGRGGTDNELLVMDRYGNTLLKMVSEDNLIGARLTPDYKYIMLFSSSRVQVYSVDTGERTGSTSFRSTLIMADYFPEDEVIVGVTGSYSEASGIIRDAQFSVVHLGQRKIARENLGIDLGMNSRVWAKLKRTGRYTYRLEGTNRRINITAGF